MIRLHDTLAREKRPFVPQNPQRITMYVCGPTVYGRAHIGNARPAVVFDTLARLIRHEYGPKSLVYARNVTDVDDKIIAAAAEEGVDPSVITERYERHYLEDMGALGVAPPDIAPHATQEIGPMIAMIERLIGLGHAYEAEGHVLFAVGSHEDYGELSRRDREAMIAGARVEVAPYKRDPADFVLWKPSEDQRATVGVDGPATKTIGWDSPWGRGRPGWHIECSAMISTHLGETIDIHGGGLDLIFPHHENEIAQSRCAHAGAPLARYWVHNGFVDMGAEKMSKSLGNVITPAQLLAQGHRGETLRLALLSAHYRSPLPWTEELIGQQKSRLDKWYRMLGEHWHAYQAVDLETLKGPSGVAEALSDDLNTPAALTALNNAFNLLSAAKLPVKITQGGEPRTAADAIRSALPAIRVGAALLGILQENPDDWAKGRVHHLTAQNLTTAPPELGQPEVRSIGPEAYIERMIAERAEAKANRDFATADRIRDELKAEGILLEDGPGGTTWRRE